MISSAGVQNTLHKFLRNENNLSSYRDNLNSVKPSFGHACLYVGFNQTAQYIHMLQMKMMFGQVVLEMLVQQEFGLNRSIPFHMIMVMLILILLLML